MAVLLQSRSAKAADFERQCWDTALDQFRKNLRSEDSEQAEKFLKSNETPRDAQNMCKKTDHDNTARYATDKSPSITIAGQKIVPKAYFVKLLQNLDLFCTMGDVVTKGGPESVGLVWMGLKFGLRMIDADYETCGVISACFADIVGIFISCRLYAQMYSPGEKGMTEVQTQLRNDIPAMLLDILQFSFSAAKFCDQGELKRWAKGILKDSKSKFDGKAKTIRDHHEKLLKHAQQAHQEETTYLSRSMAAQVDGLATSVDSLVADSKAHGSILRQMQERMDAEKKYSRPKTFDENQKDKFDSNVKALNSLVDIKALHARNLASRESGTCRWIFDLPEYQQWRQSDVTQTMLISGEAGFGKSTLVSTILEELNKDLDGDNDSVLHYFFCRTGNDDTQTAGNILGNLVYQIYQNALTSGSQLERCNAAFSECEKSTAGVLRSPADLYATMGSIVDKRIFLIIDALDECSDGFDLLIKQLQEIAKHAQVKLKMLVSSRPNFRLTEETAQWQFKVHMKEHNEPDIRKKVERGLSQIPGLTTEERQFACNKITEKAEGEFSHVDIAINFLRQPWRRTSDGAVRTLARVLEGLPPGLHGSYEMAFGQINDAYVELAKTCLRWTLLTEGTITVNEIMDAYDEKFLRPEDAGGIAATTNDDSQQATLSEQIQRACDAFLEIDKSTEVWSIKLRHASVKDYFLKDSISALQSTCEKKEQCTKCGSQIDCRPPFHVYKKEDHLSLAIVILRHLNSTAFQSRYLPFDHGPDSQEITESNHTPDTHDAKVGDAEVSDAENAESTAASLQDAEPQTFESSGEPQPQSPTEIDHVGRFVDGEDDYDIFDDEALFEGWDPAEPPRERYEITHWVYHVRQCEQLWILEERKGNPQWTTLVDLIESFLMSPGFNTWWARSIADMPMQSRYDGDSVKPLHVATGFGLLGLTQELIDRGHSANEPSSFGETPLHFATKLGTLDLDLLTILLENGKERAQPNFVPAKDPRMNEPPPFFRLLNFNPNLEAVELFIRNGASCVEPYCELTPLHVFMYNGYDPQILDVLLKNGADINAKDEWGETPLHILVKRQDAPLDLVQALLDHEASVSVDDRRSQRPLYEASEAGSVEVLRKILSCKPELDDQDDLGMTAMHIAAFEGNNEIIENLRDAGASMNLPDFYNRTPLMFACLNKQTKTAIILLESLKDLPLAEINVADKDGRTPLRKAARHGLTEVMVLMLTMGPTPDVLDAVDHKVGRTALHVAAYNGHCEAVKTLLNNHASTKIEDKQGQTAFDLCHEGWERGQNQGSEDTLLALLSAESGLQIHDPSILCTAARKGSLLVIKKLVDLGVNVHAKDNHGWSALATARLCGQKDAAALLETIEGEIATRPSRWHKPNERYNLSDDGLTLDYIGDDALRVCVLADHPIPATCMKYYFEIEILEDKKSTEYPILGIGFSTKHAKLLDRMPGWRAPNKPAWGFHGDDGYLFSYKGDVLDLAGYKPYTYGQTVGCGVDFTAKSIFYTLNGERLESAFEPVHDQLFPIVGTNENIVLRANFGRKPFQWADAVAFCKDDRLT